MWVWFCFLGWIEMKGTTMSKTAIILLVICTLIAALVGAALPVLLVGQSSTVVSGGSTAAPVRRIDVTGSGSVYAAPDQATVQLGVTSQAASAAEALKDNSAKTAVVLTSIKNIGVDAKDIQTNPENPYYQRYRDGDADVVDLVRRYIKER
jgi:uncharacterized protein YggE